MRRAQPAAEAGMDAARDLLRRARAAGGALSSVDGEPLTVERVKSAMAGPSSQTARPPTTSSSRPGAQGAVGHHMGAGPIHAGEPIVIDLWPRDNESVCFCRHDTDVRRRRRPGRRRASGTGSARRRSTARSPRSRTASTGTRRSSTAPATSSRRRAIRRSGRRRRGRRSPTASSTGSATASGSRCTRRPGMGLAVEERASSPAT